MNKKIRFFNKYNRKNLLPALSRNGSFFLLAALLLLSQILTGGLFFTYDNLNSIVRQIAVTAIISVGFTVLMASGGIDLSVSSMLSLLGCIYAVCALNLPMWLSVFVAIICGAACGFLNGCITELFELPAFIITLAMSQVYKGLAYLLTDGASIGGLPSWVTFAGQGIVFGFIPFSLILLLAISLAISFMMNRTQFGRFIIASGGNPESARSSGINVTRIKTCAYMIAGITTAIAAIVLTGRVSIALPGAGDGMETDVIAAVVIGGTPITGGRSRIFGTLCGCFIIGVLGNLMNITGVPSFWQWVFKGAIIVIAVVSGSNFSKRVLARKFK